MGAIKLAIKSRSGRDVLPDGILVPEGVSGGGRGALMTGVGGGLGASSPRLWPTPPRPRARSPDPPPPPFPPLLPQATVEQLKQRFAELKPRYYPSRQRLTLPPRDGGARSGEALADGKRLSDYGLADGSVLFFKDLGPQVRKCCGRVAWAAAVAAGGAGAEAAGGESVGGAARRALSAPSLPACAARACLQIAYAAVFFWEYFGPLAVYPLFYFLPQLFYAQR